MFKVIIRYKATVVKLPQSEELSKKQSKYFSKLNKNPKRI